MRRFTLYILVLGILGYGALQLVFSSTAVQRRLLSELQATLSGFGIDLQMESIELSGFPPRLYLNRVRLSTKPEAPIQLVEPLVVDKIRVSFQPLALIQKKLLVTEFTLFHPRLYMPNADLWVERLQKLLKKPSAPSLNRTQGFSVEFRQFGIVDALVNVTSSTPQLSVRSPSLSVFLDLGAKDTSRLRVETRGAEIGVTGTKVLLNKVDTDVDFGPKSLRINRVIVASDKSTISIKGVTRLPLDFKENAPSAKFSFTIESDLSEFSQIPGLLPKKLQGNLSAEGMLDVASGVYRGGGKVQYRELAYSGYRIGNGRFDFGLKKDRLEATDLRLDYSSGVFTSPLVSVLLTGEYPVTGHLKFDGLKLKDLLESLRVQDPPVEMTAGGMVELGGGLFPLKLETRLSGTHSHFKVLGDPERAGAARPTVIAVPSGDLKGTMTFDPDRMLFDANIAALEGTLNAQGVVNFDDTAHFRVEGKDVSLTRLARIGTLPVGGVARVSAEVDVAGEKTRIASTFDVHQGVVASIALGPVKGEAYYQGGLLTFEGLEVPSIDRIRGNGFVDFSSPETHYKFYVDGPRTEINQVALAMRSLKFSFPLPDSGETGMRLTIEGGHEGVEFEITASGQARDFNWYGEKWRSGSFSIFYRDGVTEVRRVLLHKNLGSVDLQGHFDDDKNELSASVHSVAIESLGTLVGAPVQGELRGRVQFAGKGDSLLSSANGELRLTKTKFRGQPVPDSDLKIRTSPDGLEVIVRVVGNSLVARYWRPRAQGELEQTRVEFDGYDFAALLTLWMGKDITPLNKLVSSGQLELRGSPFDLSHCEGTGTVERLSVFLRSTTMELAKPIQFAIASGQVHVPLVTIASESSRLTGSLDLTPGVAVKATLEGRLDLEYLQPFVPGLDSGAGTTEVNLQFTGSPKNFKMLGRLSLEDGVFRILGLNDDVRAATVALSLSQDRWVIDRFEGTVNGGKIRVTGEVQVDQFNRFAPNVLVSADQIGLNYSTYLKGKVSGNIKISGEHTPYLLSGDCQIHEATLSSFNVQSTSDLSSERSPGVQFDLRCQAPRRLFVATDILNAEFGGKLHLQGTNRKPGLLGEVDSKAGKMFFRETQFNLDSGSVRFETPNDIVPKFRVSGSALVKELPSGQGQSVRTLQEYQVSLQVSGVPTDYRIRLSSTPSLLEQQIISLLVLGVTNRTSDSGSYLDLGTALAGQIPIQSKIQNELGVDVKIRSQQQSSLANQLTTTGAAPTAPTVELQKDITKSTRLSFSNSLDTTLPTNELRIQQVLDENITVNASRRSQTSGTPVPSQAYGVDIRYRFQFE